MMENLSYHPSFPCRAGIQGLITPVKTGVHPHPLNLDTVSQRYDGRLSGTLMPAGVYPEPAEGPGMTNSLFA
jgi:hypothetical protein